MDEIERRFIVDDATATDGFEPTRIEQRYLPDTGRWTVRLRRSEDSAGVRHVLTLKDVRGPMTCEEIETPISAEVHDDAARSAGAALIKTRRRIPHGDHTIEVDAYLNPELDGIIVAEVELPHEDAPFDPPTWLGREITGEKDMSNAALATRLERKT